MTSPFAYKLRLTAAALGCSTRKDLCQRFRAVNPATVVDLERMHKWLQGVAQPRGASIYDDWARLLGPDWTAAWISASKPEAFAEALCRSLSADRAEIEARAAAFRGPGRDPSGGSTRSQPPRASIFLAYSWAMAPRFEGSLIRGVLTLTPGRSTRHSVSYVEGFPGGQLRFDGSATASGRTIVIDLSAKAETGLDRLFMILLTRGRPLDVLCGEFVGVPVHDTAPVPTASRIVLLRIAPETEAAAAAPDCYVAAEETALLGDLSRLGFAMPGAQGLVAPILDFLSRPRPCLALTTQDELAALATVFDACGPVEGQLLTVMR